MLSVEQKTSALASLEAVINKFNTELKEWREQTGCECNLGWFYTDGKTLQITEITEVVYKMPTNR